MPSVDNLVKNSDRTPEERKKLAKKAGIASGEARRRKKSLKNTMRMILELPVTKREDAQMLLDAGIDLDSDGDNQTLMLTALFREAVGGNVKAVREIRNILGEQTETPLEAKERKLRAEKAALELKELKQEGKDDAVETFLQAAVPSEVDTKELFADETTEAE